VIHSLRPVPNKPTSGLIQVDSNIWTIEAKGCVCYRPPMQPRYPYTHRAIIIRLNHSSLFVISPIQLTPDIQADVARLGTVKYLVSPNHLHHLYLGDWSQAYPDAKVYASPRLASKRKDLMFYKTLSTDTPEPEWAGQIDQCLFGSGNGWIDELVFFHRESRTIIFTDLVMDFDPLTFSPFSRVTTRWNQMYQHTPRGVQFGHIFDRASLRSSLETVRTWEADRAIVAHSPWLCVDGKEQVAVLLDSAFDWLTPKPPLIERAAGVARLLTLLLVILPVHAFIVLIADIFYPRLMRQGKNR
jgi:Domain of unknown function (DUF4336)